jgi:viroplasmin and RNaseH domain-containing protein
MVLNRNECEAQVKGFSGARYKKFSTQNEADKFLNSKNDPCNKQVTNDQALSDENTSMTKKIISHYGLNHSILASKATKSTRKYNKSKKAKFEVAQNFTKDDENDLEFDNEDLDEYDRIKEQLKLTVDKKIPFSFGKSLF